MQATKDNPDFVLRVEGELVAFVADSSRRRHQLAAMSANQRALVHELAEAYGLATASTG